MTVTHRIRPQTCKSCNIFLIEGENWYPYDKEKRYYICKKCRGNRTSKRRKEQGYKSTKDWDREHRLHTPGGRYYGILKRKYPIDEACEICGKKGRKLIYHHWNDDLPELGIWTCLFPYHGMAHGIEDSLIETYLTLKAKINSEYYAKNSF